MINIKKMLSTVLVTALVSTTAITAVSAEEAEPTIPNLTGKKYITIDEINPGTSVRSFSETVSLADNEEVKIYNSDGVRLFDSGYIGNGTTVVIFEDEEIKEVYKIRLYGDHNGDGRINAADLAGVRKTVLGATDTYDGTVCDINADGGTDIKDLIKLKKCQANTGAINQSRMFAYSSRFSGLNSAEVPFTVDGYEETFEDFAVASGNIDLTFNRYYSSSDASGNMLGENWTASFEGSCKAYGENSVIVRIYGRSPLVFKLNNGKYSCGYSRAALTSSGDGFVFTDESGLKYTFNTSGYLVKITDKNNNNITVSVDANGKIQKVTDSVGREFLYAYNSAARLISITDCMQRTVRYTYGLDGRLSAVIGVMGTVTENYTYNTNGKLIKVSDAFGNRITGIAYKDNSGTVVSVTDSDGGVTGYAYSSEDNSVTVSKDNEVTERRVYNRYNYPTISETADGTQRSYYCNAYGDIAVSESPDGSKTFYTYDSKGNSAKVTTVSAEETKTEISSYDRAGNLVKSVTEDGAFEYTYDEHGNTLTVKKTAKGEEDEITTYTYNADGNVATAVTGEETTAYTYDSNGYMTGETTGETSKTYGYNSVGWLQSETADGKTLSYNYNLNGDKIRTAENSTVKSRTVYDNYGRIRQQISGNEYNADYDSLNAAQSTDNYTDSNAGIRYYYGTNGKLSQVKASCYAVTANSDNKVTSVTAGNTVLAQYTYNNDAKKLISAVNYANGQSISYNYNENGNISSLYYGDTLAYTYLYNSENTLTAKINHIDNVRTDYTGSNALVSDINADGTLTEKYSYAFARLNKVKQPAGTIADDEFDAVPDGEEAELERITESFGGETFFTDYYDGYLKYGNITRTEEKTENTLNRTKTKNGRNVIISSEYEYNDNGIPVKLIQRFGGLKKTYNYTYGTDGNITAVTEETDYNYSDDSCELPPVDFDGDTTETGSKETRYYYDNQGQLIRTDDEKEDKTSVYEYDGNGNITAVKTYALHAKDAALGAPVSVKTFGYNAGDWTDLLTSVDGNTVTYDALGNMLMYNGYTYIWQAGRRLAGMTDGENTYSYKYDDSGIRTEKTVNGVTTHYTAVDGRITGQYDGTNTLYFRYDADNSPIGFNLNGTEYVYFKNIQGDIEEILDVSGNSVVKYAYNEWGKVLSVTGSMAAAVGQINPIRYRGYYYDSETGYYYLQSRYYNPDICRFINADEPSFIGVDDEEISYNLLAYCANNPIKNVDPNGHWMFFWDAMRRMRWSTAYSNYDYNRKFDINNGYIYGQSRGRVAWLRFGFFKMWYNGCEVIAIYNALRLKGKGMPLSRIAFEMEVNGASTLYGVFGSNPYFIGKFLRANGIRYKISLSVANLNKNFRRGGIYIISFWNTKTVFGGIHTVAVNFLYGRFNVYNLYGNCTEPVKIYSCNFKSIYIGGRFIVGYYLY